MDKKKIAFIILGVVIVAFVLLVAYLSLAENPLFFGGKDEPEISGNWPPPQEPSVFLPPKILSGSTTGVVKEVRVDKKEILAEVSLPYFSQKSREQFERRILTLKIADNALVQSIASGTKGDVPSWTAAALNDIKTGDKISLEYKGDILNPATQSLSVTSVKIYRIIKK